VSEPIDTRTGFLMAETMTNLANAVDGITTQLEAINSRNHETMSVLTDACAKLELAAQIIAEHRAWLGRFETRTGRLETQMGTLTDWVLDMKGES
jgi:hypothetical protein